MALNIAQKATRSQNVLALQQVFSLLEGNSCPRFYNFHMHTVCSDGKLKPEELMEQAVFIGLKGMAITDHHSVGGYKAACRWLENVRWKNPSLPLPHLWTGIEITSDLGGTEVHILGYAFAPEHQAIQIYLTGDRPKGSAANASNVITALHQAGGLAVLAHPARYRRRADELIPLAAELGIDGVETYYAYGNPDPWKFSPLQTQQVKKLSAQYNLFNTCGTDTHGSNILRRL